MGNWQLEVGKMALYMSFPVMLFHYFNQPQYFENWVTNKKREIYPPENEVHRQQIQKLKHDMRQKELLSMEKDST